MPVPLFPSLKPKLIDSAWFNVDQPCDDENEVALLEQEHQAWRNSIAQKDDDLIPIGRTVSENHDEDDEEDEDDNDDDDESESHDEEEEDEMDMDGPYEPNSPVI